MATHRFFRSSRGYLLTCLLFSETKNIPLYAQLMSITVHSTGKKITCTEHRYCPKHAERLFCLRTVVVCEAITWTGLFTSHHRRNTVLPPTSSPHTFFSNYFFLINNVNRKSWTCRFLLAGQCLLGSKDQVSALVFTIEEANLKCVESEFHPFALNAPLIMFLGGHTNKKICLLVGNNDLELKTCFYQVSTFLRN